MTRIKLPRDPEMGRVPRCGYEVCLHVGERARYWLQSTGHAQFGAFGVREGAAPFVVMRVDRGGW